MLRRLGAWEGCSTGLCFFDSQWKDIIEVWADECGPHVTHDEKHLRRLGLRMEQNDRLQDCDDKQEEKKDENNMDTGEKDQLPTEESCAESDRTQGRGKPKKKAKEGKGRNASGAAAAGQQRPAEKDLEEEKVNEGDEAQGCEEAQQT